jgi:hypothetical protein
MFQCFNSMTTACSRHADCRSGHCLAMKPDNFTIMLLFFVSSACWSIMLSAQSEQQAARAQGANWGYERWGIALRGPKPKRLCVLRSVKTKSGGVQDKVGCMTMVFMVVIKYIAFTRYPSRSNTSHDGGLVDLLLSKSNKPRELYLLLDCHFLSRGCS